MDATGLHFNWEICEVEVFIFFNNWIFIANWDFTFQARILGRAETRTTRVTIVYRFGPPAAIFFLQNTTLRMLSSKTEKTLELR